MEVIMSSPVQECSLMENGAPKLTKSQRKNRRKALKKKLIASLASLEKREVAENPKSKPEIQIYTISPTAVQDNPNSDIGAPATGDKSMAIPNPAVTRDEKSSDSKGNEQLKVVNGEIGSSMTTNLDGDAVVEKKMETEMGIGATLIGDAASKKRKSKKMKNKLNNNPDTDAIFTTPESTQDGLSSIKVLQEKSGEIVLGLRVKHASPIATLVSKGDHTEVANHKVGENETTNLNVNDENKKKRKKKLNQKQPTLSEILNPQNFQNLETANGETVRGTTITHNPASKKHETHNVNKNPDLGNPLSTRESTQEEPTTTEVLEVKCGETTTSDASMVSKVEDYTEVANGKEKKRNLPTLGEIYYLQHLQNLETASRKHKRQKLNDNPDSGDILSIRECIQEGLTATKVFELQSGKTFSGKTTTSDANMVLKGVDHTEGDTNKMQENEIIDLNVNGKKKKRKKSISKNKGPTLDESLNPQHLNNLEAAKHETGSGTIATDNPTLKNQKTQEINYNPPLGDLLSICENTQDNEIAKKDVSTSIVLEVVSGEKVSRGEEHMKDAANREMCSTTIVLKSAEPADLGIVKSKANSALTRKSQTLWVKEITPADILGKKLLIFDVNGLLADVVSPKPKDIKADMYLLSGQAIFKRPYLDDFLSFCFERFNVGIWSSRKRKSLLPVVNFLLRGSKTKLLFLWDGSKCTNSGVKTREVKDKRVVVKDLRYFWDKDGPCKLWVKGTFDESNTLLVDDSPYKALLNPKHTGIFPASYSYKNNDDNFLAPKGELQTYLEGLAVADDVRTYVAQHPFGQSAIDEQSPDWDFYSNVLGRLNSSILLTKGHSAKLL